MPYFLGISKHKGFKKEMFWCSEYVYLPPKGYASLDVGMMGVGQCPVTALDSNKLEEEAEVEKDSIEEILGMITYSFFSQFID